MGRLIREMQDSVGDLNPSIRPKDIGTVNVGARLKSELERARSRDRVWSVQLKTASTD